MAEGAAAALAALVDDRYPGKRTVTVVVLGRPLQIPDRIHIVGLKEAWPRLQEDFSPAVNCLCARSTDAYVRHAALQSIMSINESWVIPFVVLLAGEYVVEIATDMVAHLPNLDRGIYTEFVRENRPLMRHLRMKAISYWNCYYRAAYTDRSAYPGLVFLHQLEAWAA
jgi:hypothetical protein